MLIEICFSCTDFYLNFKRSLLIKFISFQTREGLYLGGGAYIRKSEVLLCLQVDGPTTRGCYKWEGL